MRKNSGFSLMEMLIVVAITVVFLAFGIPALFGLIRNLKITEMDGYAREIYVEMQNRLVAMKASSELSDFRQELATNYTDRKLGTLGEDYCPVDYDGGDENWKELYYVTANDGDAVEFLASQGIVKSGAGGYYIVELNPLTGDVYSVFYADQPIAYLISSDFDIHDLQTRTKAERISYMAGYYNGSLDTSLSVDTGLGQTLTVVNKEELYLKISYWITEVFPYLSNLDIYVTIADSDGTAFTQQLNGADLTISGNYGSTYVLLDSMEDGYHFADIAAGSTGFAYDSARCAEGSDGTLAPGDDLTITVSCDFKYSIYSYTNETTATVNSLFASKRDNTIEVAYVRHLNNLRSSIYAHSSGTATIAQIRNIDFADDANYNWNFDGAAPVYDTAATGPLTNFPPIENDDLLTNGTTVDGGYYTLSNFVITATGDTGLFADVWEVSFRNLRIVDPVVLGTGDTGALAGSIRGDGSVTDCGIYLSTQDAEGTLYINQTATGYENMMEQRQATYTVTSQNGNGGGLFGSVTKSIIINNSFAAINVHGSTTTGGLVGECGDALIQNSYSSGSIYGTSYIGGLIGRAKATAEIDLCYSTSDVVAAGYAGGLIGRVTGNADVTRSSSYGKISTAGGAVPTNSGGLIGASSASVNCAGCRYLYQNKYNDADSLNNGYGTPTRYTSLSNAENWYATSTNLTVGKSHPYRGLLSGVAFPFEPVCAEHYGDWPEQYTIQASLVYYEKYADESYGFYCETSMEGEDNDANNWKLDSLRDETCIEDGYALMSIYDLVSFKYSLNDSSTHALTLSSTPDTNSFVLLAKPANVTFTHTDGDELTVSYLYLYQLPFALQQTNRDVKGSFFDELVVTDGYADGQSPEGTPALEAYTFYYNPHFSKNAINPNPEDPDAQINFNDPSTIYVRSARQINDLGRYFYYWNPSNSGLSVVTFLQETDINFSSYVQTYCGVTFNLMDTSASNPYRNKPIGRSGAEAEEDHGNYYSDNFQNVYNGQGHKVIDFRIEASNYQFLGLFGEIEKATLTNIIMETNPNSSTYGYIRNYFNDGYRSPGTGALLGLVYAETSNIRTNVVNCAVSGYTVLFSTGTSGQNCSVGGLVGYNMGTIRNCSAVGNLAQAEFSTRCTGYVAVGGLVGSNMQTISDCYAGGNLQITGTVSNPSIGGIAGELNTIYTQWYHRDSTISSCYSYCDVGATTSTYNTRYYAITGDGVFNDGAHYMDSQATTNCYYLQDTVKVTVSDLGTSTALSFSGLAGLNEEAALSDAFGRANTANSHPWTEYDMAFPFPAVVVGADDAYIHYGDWPVSRSFVYYELYTDGTFGLYSPDGNTLDVANEKSIESAGYGFMTNGGLSGIRFSIAGGESEAVSSYVMSIPIELSGMLLYPLTDPANAQLQSILTGTQVDVTVGGVADDTFYVQTAFAAAISGTSSVLSTAADPLQVRTAQQFMNIESVINPHFSDQTIFFNQTHNVEISDQLVSNPASVGLVNLNSDYTYDGNDNSVSGLRQPLLGTNAGTVTDLAVSGSAVEMNNVGLFANVNNGVVTGCSVRGSTLTSSENAAGFIYTNNGDVTSCSVTDSSVTATQYAAGFAYENGSDGEISGCYAAPGLKTANYALLGYSNMLVQSAEASGFAYVNSGEISDSFAVGTVSGTTRAAGFALTAGNTLRSYANCAVTAGSDGTAYGFAMSAGNMGAPATDCYAAGTVTASGTVGFANEGYATDCYTLSLASDTSITLISGFGSAAATNCYWAYEAESADSAGYNVGASGATNGTARMLSQMQSIALGSEWGSATAETSHAFDPNLAVYPFPALIDLDHFGDWPEIAEPDHQGAIGVLSVHNYRRYYYWYYYRDDLGYDSAAKVRLDNLMPQAARSGDDGYSCYVYVSDADSSYGALTPAFNGIYNASSNYDGWTVSYSRAGVSLNTTPATNIDNTDGYTLYEITGLPTSYNQPVTVSFYLNGELQFTLVITYNRYNDLRYVLSDFTIN